MDTTPGVGTTFRARGAMGVPEDRSQIALARPLRFSWVTTRPAPKILGAIRHREDQVKTKCQGAGTDMSTDTDLIVVAKLDVRDKARIRRDRLRRKILGLVRESGWRTRIPGIASWTEARHEVGGRILTPEFREVVSSLLLDGSIVELWSDDGSAREYSHRLVLPGNRASVPGVVVQARGRRDRIDAEYGDVAARP